MIRFYTIYSFLTLVLFCSCSSDTTEEVKVGGIAGSVSDRTTGEPVATVNVNISPGGSSAITGSDGTFSFRNLEEGNYTLTIIKEGYKQNSSIISVRAGDPTSAHLLIERIPAVVTADRELLDFGANESTNTLSFNIVNPGYVDLEWEIEEHCEWIAEVSPAKGTLKYGKTVTIVVIIDRDLLLPGSNEAVIVVSSSNGSSEVKVVAIGAERYVPQLNTLEATEIAASTATLNGEILNAGVPAYIERGFVYSLNSMPTFDNMLAKLTSPVTDEVKYSYVLNGLTLGKKYYVRAYAINSVGTAYSSNEINFTTVASSPELTIQDVTDMSVAKKSATFNGTVVKTGDPAYFERGFVYSTDSNPTINNTKVKTNGTGKGIFSANVSGLTLNQRYYVRAYAISKLNDSEQEVYSKDEVQFTISTTVPQVSIQEVSNLNISAATATFNGTVVNVGNPAYMERGFVYGTMSNPDVDDIKVIVSGTGDGMFSADISGLQLNQRYYVRAYAISKINEIENITYSSEQVNFTLTSIAPTISVQEVTNLNVSAGTATFNGIVVNAGEPAYVERGFVYSTMSNPTVYDIKVKTTGTGVGAFSANISGLKLSQQYYVRAYAIYKIGATEHQTYSSEQVTFILTPTAPSVSIEAVTNLNVTAGTVTFNGTITNVGNPSYTERGFVYSETRNPTISDTKMVASGNGAGMYSINVSNLDLNKTYYVRAYVISSIGVVYSPSDISFILSSTTPQVAIQAATNINIIDGTATLNGTIIKTGEPPYTERGFVYGLYRNPTLNDEHIAVSGNGTGSFRANIELLLDRTYYVRAYATNTFETVYSSYETTVSTMAILPQIKTYGVKEASAVNQTAIFEGYISDAGTPSYTECGFVYSETVSEPTVDDNKVISSKVGTSGVYTVQVSNLPTTNYYIRAYATNRGGTVYGESILVRPPYLEIPEGNIAVQSSSIGTGKWETVSAMCESSTLDGYTDWRLPTNDELMIIYNNRKLLGYSDYIFWSSEIYSDKGYYAIDFSSGKLGYLEPNLTAKGRCVRTLR